MKTNIEEVVDNFLNSHAVEEGTQDERDLMKEIYNDKSYSVNRSSLINFIAQIKKQERDQIHKDLMDIADKWEIEDVLSTKAALDGAMGAPTFIPLMKRICNDN